MAKMIHSMVRVLDEARSLDFYQLAFGFRIIERLDFETFTLIYLGSDETPFELELTVNKGRTEPYQMGDGYGHLAVSVDDIEAEHARFTEAGLAPGKLLGNNGLLQSKRFFQFADGALAIIQRAQNKQARFMR